MKIYFEGEYFYTDRLDKEAIKQRNPRAFAYLSRKLGWISEQKTKNESINKPNTEKKRGKTRQTKGDIQQRGGQRIPAKDRKANK